jgi:hypothetical protein
MLLLLCPISRPVIPQNQLLLKSLAYRVRIYILLISIVALSQTISHFLNQHCSPWKAVSLERDESVSSGPGFRSGGDIHASGLQPHAALCWNDDRAYYPNSGLMNGVVSRGWPKERAFPLTGLLFSSFISANGGTSEHSVLFESLDYDCCVSKREGGEYRSFLRPTRPWHINCKTELLYTAHTSRFKY